MTVLSARVNVSTTPIRLDAVNARVQAVAIRNRGTAAVFLGPAAVTTATGFQLDAGESVSFELTTDLAPLFAVAASGTHVCHVLQVGA